jgi:hypothetical protein
VHDILEITPKAEFLEVYAEQPVSGLSDTVRISSEGYEKARDAAPSWDVYFLEQEWRMWMSEVPRHADGAFVGFCRKWYDRKGKAP